MENGLKVTVEYDGRKVTWEMPLECDLEDMKQLFTEIMIFMTFHPNTVKALFGEEDENSDL